MMQIGPAYVAITLVETMGNMEEMRKLIARKMAREYGGVTCVPQVGGYVMETGEYVEENGVRLISYIADNQLEEAFRFIAHIASVVHKSVLNAQETILIEVSEGKHLVDKFDAKVIEGV